MTPEQRALARHALGLPNRRRRSYRNSYSASYSPGGAYDLWSDMVDAGLAERYPTITGSAHRKMARFWLTDAGARAALDPGESLCPEDFPQTPTPRSDT
ncbi:MAG: hypothetical protein CMK96_06240 [Pseudomonas sp.]|nr:hypothetical protein [Pseudomonas sp.]